MKNKVKIKSKNTHFCYEERVKIEFLLNDKISLSEIAGRMQRSKSSVSDEIRLNSVKGVYTAKKAHLKSYQRRWRARYQSMKIAANALLRDYVESRIKRYWSPEDISGRIKFIDTNIPYANKDTIYKYVKSVYGRNLESFLWFKGKKRKISSKRSDLEDREFIDSRPKSVFKRRYFWDWEADFIVSGKHGKGALLVFVERKSRYVLIFKLADRKVETINFALRMIFGSGQLICNTLTIDNDICFRHHKQMSKIIGAPIFFCHPYHSWEKGTVEKMNQMIRRFIKKGCNIDKISEKKVKWVEEILNDKPYKCMGFYTPKEVLLRSRDLKVFVMENFNKKTPLTLQKCSD
jgi:transposase, IS30 family